MESQAKISRPTKTTWTITINGTPVCGGSIESWIRGCWINAKAMVEKNGGCAQLISGISMVIEEYRRE